MYGCVAIQRYKRQGALQLRALSDSWNSAWNSTEDHTMIEEPTDCSTTHMLVDKHQFERTHIVLDA